LLFLAQTRGFESASITQKLFGRGLHTTAAVSVEYSPLPDINPRAVDFEEGKVTAHNQVLRLVTETGLIGAGIFAALVLCVIRVLTKVVRGAPERDDRQFAIAVLSVMAALGFYSISATPFDSPAVSWPLWFAVGVAAAPVVNGERSLKGENW
jgi:O-antigen ligase